MKPVTHSQMSRPLFILNKVIRSDVRIVDDVVGEIAGVLKCLDSCNEVDLIAVAIREALSNALVHGNRYDPEKPISLFVRLNDDGSLFVSVKDSGSGFDPNALPDPLAVENLLRGHGRGIFLMRQLMDEVEFNFDHGTEVRMRRTQTWLE